MTYVNTLTHDKQFDARTMDKQQELRDLVKDVLRDARALVERLEQILSERPKQCDHDAIMYIPSGPRDNNERYYKCRKCNCQL